MLNFNKKKYVSFDNLSKFSSMIQKALSDKLKNVETDLNEKVDSRFKSLTAKEQADSEVIDARNGEVSLGARLEKMEDLSDTLSNTTDNIIMRFEGTTEYLYNNIKEVDSYINKKIVRVEKLGVVPGTSGNPQENARIIQEYINRTNGDCILVFDNDIYLVDSIDFGTKRNITLCGFSSSFASTMNKNINTGKITDTFTKIVSCCPPGETLFKHNNCVFVFDKLGFYGYEENSGLGTGYKKPIFLLSVSTENTTKGKVFATDCCFYGFKVAFGDKYTYTHLEREFGTNLPAPSKLQQTCVVANRCRFLHNGIAINQNVDGRLVDCSFNKNDYAMVFRQSSGFSTISSCRIEWNNCIGVCAEQAHDITVTSCEFDRNGQNGIYISKCLNSNFSDNVFRRNGAMDELDPSNYEYNSHIFFYQNTNCMLSSNTTVAKHTLDTSSGGKTRPSNVSSIEGNESCIIVNNMLVGCTKSDKLLANRLSGNTNCVIKNNIPDV